MISSQAFEKLSAMGIELYQLKNDGSATPDNEFLAFDQQQLKDSQLFSDLLLVLNVSIAEVEFSDRLIDLGLFCWAFHDSNEISFNANQLRTPSLNQISQSPVLKKQLWQTITP